MRSIQGTLNGLIAERILLRQAREQCGGLGVDFQLFIVDYICREAYNEETCMILGQMIMCAS